VNHVPYKYNPINNLDYYESSTTIGQTTIVAKVGGDYTTIEAALAAASGTLKDTILVYPGTYTENNPLQHKANTTIIAAGGQNTVEVVAQNANANLFNCVSTSYLIDLHLKGVTGSYYAVEFTTPGFVLLDNIFFEDCSNCVHQNNAASQIQIRNATLYGTFTTGFFVEAGNIIFDYLTISGSTTTTTAIRITGANSITTINNFVSFSSNLTTGMLLQDQCRVVMNTCSLVGMNDGIIIEGATVKTSATFIFNAQQDGIRMNNTGTNPSFACQGCTVEDSTRYNYNVLSPTAIVTGIGSSAIDKFNFVNGAQTYAAIIDTKEDDEGFNILGELHVGLPENGDESVFGEGDSYTRGMLVYTETSGGTFANVTTNAATPSGSTFTFPGTAAGNAIYIASSLQGASDVLSHYGIKTKVNTAAVKGTGNIILEYWNGSAWVEENAMEADSSGSYYPHGKNYFQSTGSHHMRYNSSLVTDNWTKNDPISPSIGTSYYWVRFRITSTITTAPVFEQFKLHTSRTEINSDGWTEYFGKARPIGQLNLSFAQGKPFEGVMSNQTLYISQDIGVGGTNNKFTSTTDKMGVSGFLPFDCDTSSPLKVTWAGHPNSTGTYNWTVRWAWVTEGNSITYTEPASITASNSTTTSKAATEDEIAIFEAELDISEMISRRNGGFGDEIWISIQPTTLPGNFSLAGSQVTYTKWCEGGHIG
jgi:hypothetical protein